MEGRGFEVSFMAEAEAFVMSLPEKARKKVTYNILRVSQGEINNDLFKKLSNTEIWEFRTLFEGMCYRLFAFWDTEDGALVVATHGLVKKTQKTPAKEIRKAEALRLDYFKNK